MPLLALLDYFHCFSSRLTRDVNVLEGHLSGSVLPSSSEPPEKKMSVKASYESVVVVNSNLSGFSQPSAEKAIDQKKTRHLVHIWICLYLDI